MELPSLTVLLCGFALVIVLNYLFLDDKPPKKPMRAVTEQMVARVREVAPDLSIDTIRTDLRRTGDVQVTVERYLGGALSERSAPADRVEPSKRRRDAETGPLRPEDAPLASAAEDEPQGPFNGLTYEQVKRNMVLAGRKSAQEALAKEIPWID